MLYQAATSSLMLPNKLGNIDQVLDGFSKFCLIDLRLSPETAHRHMLRISKYLRTISSRGQTEINQDVIRNCLGQYVNRSPYLYANVLKALKVFHRDYLGHEDLVKTFKFPRLPFRPKTVPSREELLMFYSAFRSQK